MDNLKQIKLLGEGAFGKCYLCENPTDGSKYVVKQIDISKMSPQEKKEAYHEAKVMSAFDHPNIIKFIDVYTTTNGKLNIVMNYADGGDLSSKISQQRGRLFTENEILDLFVQVMLAMKHVHDRKVIHRDIKGQNIFLMKSGLIKLGDFGISKVLNSTVDKARTMVGTPYYLSPEIVENRPYSFKSDIWSLGVLLYELCTLKPPFDGTSLRHLGLNIVRGIYPPPPPHFSRDLKMLISQMLTVDANRRPTVAQVLRMPFIKNRIQNLLSESTRFEEFSHTILHKQNLFAAKAKKDQAKNEPKIEAKPEPKIEKKPEIKPPVKEEKIEPPKFGLKEFLIKLEEDKKKLVKKDPPKPEVKEVPRPKVIEIKREEEKKPIKIEVPKFQDVRKPEPKVYKPSPRAPVMQGRLEDVFKPVDKPLPKKPDPARLQAQEELKKKKEQEARKKLDELMQKRENDKLEEQARKDAAEKKRQEKMKKIQEERLKMMEDIKQKKNNRSQNFENLIEIPLKNTPSDIPELKKVQSTDSRPDLETDSFKRDALPDPPKKNVAEVKPKSKYSEDRQKFLDALRSNRQKKDRNDFVVEWAGVQNREDQRLYEVLQEAIIESENTEETESTVDSIYITQTAEEEIVDRVDEIADKEVVVEASESQESDDEIADVDFSYNSLEAIRMLVEEKVGCELLFESYNIMKQIGDIDPLEVGYGIFYEKLGSILPKNKLEEYVSYIRTLMIFENKAESNN